MKKIATLGPKGTYSEIATSQYVEVVEEQCEILHFSSIKKALNSIGKTCDIGVLPIENLSQGYVPLVLDHIVKTNLRIIGEIFLPIQFSFVSSTPDIKDVTTIYVQFVAQNQCVEFIESLENVEIVITESNIESLNMVIEKKGLSAAVVPAKSYEPNQFPFTIENINDYENNQTRFFIFSSQEHHGNPPVETIDYKTSIVILDDNDHPGLLSKILNSFAKRQINLTSIVSRPTMEEFGKYHFFIDIEGHENDVHIAEALIEIGNINKLKCIGSYPKGVNSQ